MSTEHEGSHKRAKGSSPIPPMPSYKDGEALRNRIQKDYDLTDNVSRAILVGSTFTVEAVIDAVNVRFDEVNKRFDEVDKRFVAVDKRFDEVDKRLDKMDKRFDVVDDFISRYNKDRMQMWLGFGGIFATIVVGMFFG